MKHCTEAIWSPQMIAIRGACGMEGVGLYWLLVEEIVSHGNKLPLKTVQEIARLANCEKKKADIILSMPDLFFVEDEKVSARSCEGVVRIRA